MGTSQPSPSISLPCQTGSLNFYVNSPEATVKLPALWAKPATSSQSLTLLVKHATLLWLPSLTLSRLHCQALTMDLKEGGKSQGTLFDLTPSKSDCCESRMGLESFYRRSC